MSRTRIAVVVLALLCAFAAGASPAQARSKPAKPHCRAGYVARHKVVRRRERVRVRRHHRWVRVWRVERVRVWRCVARPKPVSQPPATVPAPTPTPASTAPTTAPTPVVTYKTTVDPTFVQDPSNPLAVTYSYSADATSTVGTATTDLATTGSLPAGVLDLYSPTAPGQPAGLVCSMNVGGAVSGGSCPVTYTQTGSYSVTTEYLPNGANPVTTTDSVVVSPFATTLTTSASLSGPLASPPPGNNSQTALPGQTLYEISVEGIVDDPSGNEVADGQPLTVALTDTRSGSVFASWQQPAGATCTLEVIADPSYVIGGNPANSMMIEPTVWPGPCPEAVVSWIPEGEPYALTSSFAGSAALGYSGSASSAVSVWP